MGVIQQRWFFALIALPFVLANPSWADQPSSDAEKTVVELYNSEKLFDKREYNWFDQRLHDDLSKTIKLKFKMLLGRNRKL